MSILYVTQPGAEVHKRGERLRVVWQEQVLTMLPLQEVERVVLLGPAVVSAAAAQELLEANIATLFCSMRGKCYGMLSPCSDEIELLLAHVACYQDEAYRCAMACGIVETKLRYQRALLQRHGRDHPEAELSGACEQIRQLAASLEERSSVPAIMGVEGQGSAVYFGVLGRCLRQEGIAFTERNRRPPRDPVNALLSLGYMLVLGEVMTTLQAAGLHRGLGFLHEVANRRPALALDVLETLREPLVDRLTLSVFNHGVFGPTDFNPQPDGGVRLKPESLRRYLPLYERTLTTNFRHPRDGHSVNFRTLLREDVGTLKAAIREHLVWKPTHLEL